MTGKINPPIYLDYQATTPVDPRVLEEMMPYFSQNFGNAASKDHALGWTAEAAVELARERIAKLIHATEKEIIFTSGATESNNLALVGVARHYARQGKRIITTAAEHSSVRETCRYLERNGFDVIYLPVDSKGQVSPQAIQREIDSQTILVSVIYANNEVGTINRIQEIGALCRKNEVLFHTDATQAVQYLDVDVQAQCVDLLSLSAHKMYGPKGAGALFVRRRDPRVGLDPLIHGGGHERGFRSGTLNTPSIVGFGRAAEICIEQREADVLRVQSLRDRLWKKLKTECPGLVLLGHESERLPHNLSFRVPALKSEQWIGKLKDVAISSGAACASGTLEPSSVLRAMGLTDDECLSSARVSLGRFTTEEEVDYAASAMVRQILHA